MDNENGDICDEYDAKESWIIGNIDRVFIVIQFRYARGDTCEVQSDIKLSCGAKCWKVICAVLCSAWVSWMQFMK